MYKLCVGLIVSEIETLDYSYSLGQFLVELFSAMDWALNVKNNDIQCIQPGE